MTSIIDAKWLLFARVAELGSISRAAMELDLPQSVVSRRITQLEGECGGALFRRTGRGVTLSDFGQLVYSRVRNLLGQASEVAEEIRTRGGDPVGVVRLGLLPATVPALAAALFSHAQDTLPHVRLHMLEGSSSQLEQWLAEGRLDFSLLLRDESAVTRGDAILLRQQLHLVAPKDGAIARRGSIRLREIHLLPLVLAARPHPARELLDRAAGDLEVDFQVIVEADSIRLQHELIASGRVYGLMLGPFAGPEHDRLAAIPVTDPVLHRCLVLAHATQRPATLATREVARWLVKQVPAMLASPAIEALTG